MTMGIKNLWSYVVQYVRITHQEVIELCRLTQDQAYKLLKLLCAAEIQHLS
jgi:hypothetical protein